MKLGICNEIFKGWKWKEITSFVKKCGYDGIEIAVNALGDHIDDISLSQRRHLSSVCVGEGLEIIGLHWLLAGTEGLCITSDDSGVRRNTRDFLIKIVRFCSDVGGKIMVLGSPGQRTYAEGTSRSEACKRAVELLRDVMEVAFPLDLVMALEPLAQKETNFITSHSEGIDLIRQVDYPCFRLHLDVKAMSYEELAIPEIIHNSKEYLAHFHVNDPNLGGPGSGNIKYEPIIQALRDIGYDRYMSVEVFDFKKGPEAIARESIAYLKSVLD